MKRLVAIALLALMVLAPASAAWAAETTPAAGAEASATPVGAKKVQPSLVDVQLWTEDGGRTSLVVVGVIPTSTPLPATVTLPVPKGAVVQWAGEVFDDSTKDTGRQPVFSPDGLSLTITTENSYNVQYEAQYAPYTDKGGRRYAKLAWVQTVPAAAEQFAVKVPAASDDVRVKPEPAGEPFTNGTGDKLYQLRPVTLDVGGKYELSADYRAGYPEVETPKSPFDYVLPVTLGLLGVAVVGLVVVAYRSRSGASAGEDEDEDEDTFVD